MRGRQGRIRPARTSDVREIHSLLQAFAVQGLMLSRSVSSLYDNLRDCIVCVKDELIKGICALHICWDDLAEVRSLAVIGEKQGSGIGRELVQSCLIEAESIEIS
ncbi:GNAT family N-acetyltransferase [Desulfogranum japonicum]|uniref:GNAT family N-acetyltransferase n=1 Tax=Desulfogranum japonicum TaxID=231447 RepID=UPI001E356CE3|nr:GNAT family N-acetyltransferase [Desulfogranum japonicum]